ncbi:MAG: molybdopterin molybdotransferase MoeA [Sediminicola sp.]
MIVFSEAYNTVLENSRDFGTERVPLEKSVGRTLAEDVMADRDFPPFDRVTKDGIALNYASIEAGLVELPIEGTIAAGTARTALENNKNCLEIMTGAVLPENTDTVVMYEHITIVKGKAHLNILPKKGQEIHYKGSDTRKGTVVLSANRKIDAAAIGILAAVGKAMVLVKKLPRIALVSTGNELVEVTEEPLPHQIRKSNMQSVHAALLNEGMDAEQLHLTDDRITIKKTLSKILDQKDVILLSGGVSKGKFDHIPAVLEELGVEKLFHGVLQRPGKPFWFGKHVDTGTIIFSFPGNPASTFVNYHLYFLAWLSKCMQLPIAQNNVFLDGEIAVKGTLTLFMGVQITLKKGRLMATMVPGNGSGDLGSLSKWDGFIILPPREEPYMEGDLLPFIPTKRIL